MDTALRKVPPFSSFMRGEHPPVNVYETDAELVVRAEVPGVAREDLCVTLKPGTLVIEGKQDAGQWQAYTCRCQERALGDFCREIALPVELEEGAEPAASLENGVLTVRLRKTGRQEGRTIEVEVR
jgi:HSP20 family protein